MTAAAAAALAISASGARAAIQEVDFVVEQIPTNLWFQVIGSGSPFGLPDAPVLTGSFDVDDSFKVHNISGANSISNLSYTTGTRTWTLADLDPTASQIFYTNGFVNQFFLIFTTPGNYVISSDTAQLRSDTQGIACNGCVTFNHNPLANIPEPQTWTLAIAGFFSLGAVLRRRRALA